MREEEKRKEERTKGRKNERRKKERKKERKENAPTETGPLPQSHAQELFVIRVRGYPDPRHVRRTHGHERNTGQDKRQEFQLGPKKKTRLKVVNEILLVPITRHVHCMDNYCHNQQKGWCVVVCEPCGGVECISFSLFSLVSSSSSSLSLRGTCVLSVSLPFHPMRTPQFLNCWFSGRCRTS